MAREKKKQKSPMFFGFILSAGLHLFIVITVLFWGVNTHPTIKQPKSITANLVSLPTSGSSGPRGSSAPKKEAPPQPKPPKKEKKPEVIKKPEPKPVKKPEIVKKPPKKVEPPKPKPPEKKAVNLNDKKKEKKAAKPTPKPTTKPKPRPKPKPNYSKQKDDIVAKIKADKEKKQREKSVDDILDNIGETVKTKQVAKRGPDGKYDVSGPSTGSPSATSSVVAGIFVNRVKNEIASNWILPPNIPSDGSLESKVEFKINASGEVYGIKITKSSGNREFDEFCKRALRKASPLDTPPPPEILREAETEGVVVTFNNSSL